MVLQVLIGFAIADLLVLVAAAALGLVSDGHAWFAQHFALGLFGTVCTALMHTLAFVYFVVSAKVVDQAVERARFDRSVREASRTHKTRALLTCLAGVGSVILAALLGALTSVVGVGTDGRYDASRALIARQVHMTAALLAISAQIATVALHAHNIRRQSALMQKTLRAFGEWKQAQRQPAGVELPRTSDA